MTKEKHAILDENWTNLYNAGKYLFNADMPDFHNLENFMEMIRLHREFSINSGFGKRNTNDEIHKRIVMFSKKHPFK